MDAWVLVQLAKRMLKDEAQKKAFNKPLSIPKLVEENEIPTIDSLLKKLVHNENASYYIPNYK